MNKTYKFLAVSMMLVVFPALSWYYLDTGLEYRKEARLAMMPKGDLDELISARRFVTDYDLRVTCEGATSMIISRKDEKNDKTIQKLFEQFDDARGFQLVLLNEKGLTPLPEFEANNFHVVPSVNNFGNEVVLLDDQLRIRSNHTFENEDVQNLVSYTALLLPRDVGRDIKEHKPTIEK